MISFDPRDVFIKLTGFIFTALSFLVKGGKDVLGLFFLLNILTLNLNFRFIENKHLGLFNPAALMMS